MVVIIYCYIGDKDEFTILKREQGGPLLYSAYWLPTRKTTLHGGQSRSWSAEQWKDDKRSLAAYLSTPNTARPEKN